MVALYPLSSPNHNPLELPTPELDVALYPLSSPNHNISLAPRSRSKVALYPLSSPNHNPLELPTPELDVALYPLSSPNHNSSPLLRESMRVALYPLSSPNHNWDADQSRLHPLRYILFHHQTTTEALSSINILCCVISSFITKPQLPFGVRFFCAVALYPLSSPNHNKMNALEFNLTVA